MIADPESFLVTGRLTLAAEEERARSSGGHLVADLSGITATGQGA